MNFKSSSDVSVCTTCFCISQCTDGATVSANSCIRTNKAGKCVLLMFSYSISNYFFVGFVVLFVCPDAWRLLLGIAIFCMKAVHQYLVQFKF